MKKIVALTLACTTAMGLFLSGCAMEDDAAGSNSSSTGTQREVVVCGWGENIDEDLFDLFEEKTGIKVIYQTAESNEMMYSKVAMGGSGYDVIVPSDYMIAQMAEEGLLAELNFDNIPNFSLIADRFKNLPYDPENLYSVPYTWGTLGIIYNPTMIDKEIDSWEALFDMQYEGMTAMIGNPRDALATALMYLGYSINTTDEAQIREAYDLIAVSKAAGVYQGFFMDEIYDKMEVGETALCTYYAGDYLSMYMNNPDLKYVIPKEGSNWFVDAMVVLKDAKHKTEAEEWINFICSTEASLRNMDFIWYASPNQEALEQYPAYYEEQTGEKLPDEVYQVMAAPQEVLDQCEMYLNLPAETRTLYNDLWTQMGVE
ncbi:ABC transporter substrate-binding protein [Flintibacter faecis]|mgnify:FL=1|uniref:Spermidine/putrescine ABC transporter substrate-binding protein n=1 Tax=Flintibacter faecis TaxID=2763047 RepID=A0A8J6J3Z8_9FIRM|nr:spermidine/putrescine ABC transporter substrate-binding protein [Flintibacter faecis]MBC5716707.1 spermidine/putrescine ABC transporter substrate-binding protein [Flintibacter faecis]